MAGARTCHEVVTTVLSSLCLASEIRYRDKPSNISTSFTQNISLTSAIKNMATLRVSAFTGRQIFAISTQNPPPPQGIATLSQCWTSVWSNGSLNATVQCLSHLFCGETPKIIVHIPRNPAYENYTYINWLLLAQGDCSNIYNRLTKIMSKCRNIYINKHIYI
jgi:hypothetical protein